MGGKSSKSNLSRTDSMRKSSVKNMVQEMKRKWEKVGDELWGLPEVNESHEVYVELKEKITELRSELEGLSDDIKKKDTALVDYYMDRYHAYMCVLEKKTVLPQKVVNCGKAVSTPELRESLESNTNSLKKKTKKSRTQQRERRVTKEEKNMNEIDRIRQEMMPMRDEILVFKGQKNDRVYHFLEESFLRFASKLEGIETFDFPQLKHEKKIAITYAKESVEVLQQIVDRKERATQEEEEEVPVVKFKEFRAQLENKLSVHPSVRSTMGMVKLKSYSDEVECLQVTKSIESLDEEYASSSSMSCSSDNYEERQEVRRDVFNINTLKVTSI
ncbi:PREDICTED: uncharacterized protein LOC108566861 [Nicrophorus vespilloides]|uniref:Uncharacterized protein LOC108566861 n=1 Tax=Nicrophorus vespilloides TaxID=110193 RepID=A0ABM1N6I4_NICVS|nr:PREDICTED: uncharacterized protein LOC108566861 [Nicrophorus vespilloides]